jgi:hypothetical protein
VEILLHELPKPLNAVAPRSLPTNHPFGKSKREEKFVPAVPSKADRLAKALRFCPAEKLEPNPVGHAVVQ